MGMSEIAANRDFCYVIKRDSQKGANTADKKKNCLIPGNEMFSEAINSSTWSVVSKELLRDLISNPLQFGRFLLDKIE